jgi:hypothetical protein
MSTQNINPKPCVNNCGIQIYWNTSVNEYWEFFNRRNIFVLIRSTNRQLQHIKQQQEQQLVILNPHIIAKTPVHYSQTKNV